MEGNSDVCTVSRRCRVSRLATAFQGAVSVAVVAAAATVVDVVTPGEVVDLPTLGVAVGTAAGTALAAWAHRLLGGDPAPQE